MNTPSLRLIVLLLIFPIFLFSQNQEGGVTISPANGEFTRCYPDTSVSLKINIPEHYTAVDSFALQWCSDCPFISIPGSLNPPDQHHLYKLAQLKENCEYDRNCNNMGVCFNARIFAYIPEKETPDNNSFTLTFLFPPEPDFSVPSTTCAKNEVRFDNKTCPSNDPSMTFWWDYGDGAADDVGIHTYQDTGFYTVTLTAMNPCDTVIKVKTIRALGLPVADIAVNLDNGLQDTICVGEVITLDGTVSTFATSYRWRITPSGYEYVSETSEFKPMPQIHFIQTGSYTIHLTVNNNCNQPSEAERTLVVIEAPNLQLDHQMNACDSLYYIPSPFEPNAIYLINEEEVDTFPILLSASADYHMVQAQMDTDCGLLVEYDTFYVNTPIAFSISNPANDTNICLGTESINFELEGIDINDGKWFKDGVEFTPPFLPDQEGSFTISFIRGSGECATSDQVIINVEDVSITVQDIRICEGATPFQIQVEPSEGTFSSIDCTDCVNSSGFFDPSELGSQDAVSVIYSLSNNIGCSTSKTFTVAVNKPKADFPVAAEYCEGENITIDFAESLGDQFLWVLDDSPSAGPPFNNLSSTSHSIELIAQIGQCADTLLQTFSVIAPPQTAQIEFDLLSGCSPLEVDFSAVGEREAEVNYSWSFNRHESDTLLAFNPPTQIFRNNTNNPIQLPVYFSADNSCAQTTDTVYLNIQSKPKALIGTILDKYCSGDTIPIINASRGIIDSYEWTYGTAPPSFDSLPPPFVFITDASTAITFRLIASNECGRDTSIKTLTIEPTDAQALFHIGRLEFCEGDTVQLTNLANTDEVLYDFNDNHQTQLINPFHIYQTHGQYLISQKAFGCGFDSTSLMLKVHQKPKASFLSPAITCPGTDIFLNNQSQASITYKWFINDIEFSNLTNPSIQLDSIGTFTINLEARSIDSCLHQFSSQIQVIAPPNPLFTIPDSICAGMSFKVTHETIDDFSGCQWAIDGLSTIDGCEPILEIAEAGVHQIELQLSNDIGCRNDSIKSIFIRETPHAVFEYHQDFSCSPSSISLTDLSSNATGLRWSFGNGPNSTEKNPTISYPNGGLYKIQLIASLEDICFDTITQEIIVHQNPQVDYKFIDERCFPGDEVIIEINNAENHFIEVNGLDNNYFQSGRNRYEITEAGTYLVYINSVEECDTSFMIEVPRFQEVTIDVMEDTIIFYGQSITIQSTLNTANMMLNWSPSESLNDPTVAEPLARPFESTLYILEAKYQNCLYHDSVFINVNENSSIPFIPQAFTPNNDGKNDTFTLYGGIGIEKIKHLQVFNRWGGLMFQVKEIPLNDEPKGWDGTYNNRPVNAGIYVYMAEIKLANGKTEILTGDLALIR